MPTTVAPRSARCGRDPRLDSLLAGSSVRDGRSGDSSATLTSLTSTINGVAQDRLASIAPVIAALGLIVDGAASSASTVWWDRTLQLHDQHFVSWIRTSRGRRALTPRLTGAARRLKAWRRATLGPNSWWWSFPDTVSTSASHATLPATQLDLLEDGLGFTRARVARLEPIASCRVLELTTPAKQGSVAVHRGQPDLPPT